MNVTASVYGGSGATATQRAVVTCAATGERLEVVRPTWRAMQSWLSKWGFSYRATTTDARGDWRDVFALPR